MPRWLLWLFTALVIPGLALGFWYLKALGAPMMGVHGTLLWLEVLMVPVVLLMTVIVYLARGRGGAQ